MASIHASSLIFKAQQHSDKNTQCSFSRKFIASYLNRCFLRQPRESLFLSVACRERRVVSFREGGSRSMGERPELRRGGVFQEEETTVYVVLGRMKDSLLVSGQCVSSSTDQQLCTRLVSPTKGGMVDEGGEVQGY